MFFLLNNDLGNLLLITSAFAFTYFCTVTNSLNINILHLNLLINLLFESDRDLPHNTKISIFANYLAKITQRDKAWQQIDWPALVSAQTVHIAYSEMLLPHGSCNNVPIVFCSNIKFLSIPRFCSEGLSRKGRAAVKGTAAKLRSVLELIRLLLPPEDSPPGSETCLFKWCILETFKGFLVACMEKKYQRSNVSEQLEADQLEQGSFGLASSPQIPSNVISYSVVVPGTGHCRKIITATLVLIIQPFLEVETLGGI